MNRRHCPDISGVGPKRGRDDTRRPPPRRWRSAEQREQRQRRGHERRTERSTGPRLSNSSPKQAVPEPERRAVAPPETKPELVRLPVGQIRQVQDPPNDRARNQASVIVAVPAVPARTAPFIYSG